MSTPDPNSSASATVSPANNVRTPPAPPPLPSPYRAIAPIQHANPLQQDPSTVLYPFAPSGRGFSVRPVRLSSPLVADQSGYSPRAGLAYSNRQFGPNQMETMMQFMRARNNPQLSPHTGSGSPVGSGPMRGIPHFLQPRVAPPPTSILDTGRNKNARRRDVALVLVRGRKVRITDGASLYSLSRSWLRNGPHEGTQSQRSETLKPLPKPLPLDLIEAAAPSDPAEEPTDEDKEDEESVKELSEKDLLKRHIEKAKKVRARLREERSRKIARYKARLALLLPHSGE